MLMYKMELKKVSSYEARYPAHRTTQGSLHFTPWQTCSLQCQLDFYGKCSATLQLLHKDYSFTCVHHGPLPGTLLYMSKLRQHEQNCPSFETAAKDLKLGSLD